MFDDTYKIYGVMTILILGAMFTAGLFLSSGLVVGQTTTDPAVDAQPNAFVRSRFMLWDTYEKSMDKRFDIILVSWANQTSNYSVQINTEYFNGTFYQYAILNFTYTNVSRITLLTVSINNSTVLHAVDIKLLSGITQGGIDNIPEPYKISFLPFELTKFEWNLVFSGIVAVFLSLPLSYYTIKYFRKHKGPGMV